MLKQKTVYFREEDLAAWDAIPNKAEWLHNHLGPKPQRDTDLEEIAARLGVELSSPDDVA